MLRFITGLSLILASLLIIYIASPISYYLKPKQERLYNVWQNDIAKLNQDKQFSGVFSNLAKIEIIFNDPEDAEEFKNFNSPFRITNKDGYILRISITRWLESNSYGFVIEHEIFDLNEDKLHEFGRTYKIGLIF